METVKWQRIYFIQIIYSSLIGLNEEYSSVILKAESEILFMMKLYCDISLTSHDAVVDVDSTFVGNGKTTKLYDG